MPIECRQSTQGGKGNRGMFIERDPGILAAGWPTAQQNEVATHSLQHYLLKDQVDALISDAIIPEPKKLPLPPLRKPIPLDTRHAGPFCDVANIINPAPKTKFRTLVDDFKETAYKSYWNKPLGQVPDAVPMLPAGFNLIGKTFGKPTAFHGRLYDIIMPKIPYPSNTLPSKEPGFQVDRNYCRPPYNPDLTYGHRTLVDKRGRYAHCCLNNDKQTVGSGNITVMNSIQANILERDQSILGCASEPNDNITQVPEGYSFGNLKPPDNVVECLTFCEINEGVEFFRKCLKHLNTVRRALSTRFPPTFFFRFYLELKYHDTENCGWLSKDIVYKECGIKLIRFDPTLIEPLLSMWKAFDGTRIEYKIFIRVINYREPSPEVPKIPSFKPDCFQYSTTYRDMVQPGQDPGNPLMAGLPSARYLDTDYPITPERFCAAGKSCFPEESDMWACISPSVLSNLLVKHRDMYEIQTPENVRRVFEAAGEKFSDKRFNAIWEEAQKLHSHGCVCYETFRQTLEKHPDATEFDKKDTK